MSIKESAIANINTAIADKTEILSVTTADVADRLKELVALLGAILVNVDLTYNVGLVVYTASPFAVYVCKVDGSSGDVSNQTNWLKIAGNGLPYLVADTEVYDTTVAYQAGNYYVPLAINLASKAGTFFALRLNGIAATNITQIAYALTIDTTGSIEGSSVIIQLDNKGVGMATLVIDGTYNERLAFGSTYLFTKTTDSDDADGYILTKIASSGIRTMTSGPFTASPGKYLLGGGNAIVLPLAAGLQGEEVEVILSSAGTLGVTQTGGDTLGNIGSLAFTLPRMRFISDGVSKWYFTA